MELRQIATGGDRNYGYLVTHGKESLVVDPGEAIDGLLDALAESGCRLRWVIGTHSHMDHIGSADELIRLAGGKLILSEFSQHSADQRLSGPRLELPLGDARVQLLATPGHTPCSLCVLLPAMEGRPPRLISGDTLFVGKIGGTQDAAAAAAEYRSLHEVLLKLPAETEVWPGHNYGVRTSSSLAVEASENPFLIQPDFEAFCHLKANWAEYKREHGIA